MTISSTTVRNSYNGDGSTATFSYTFKIFANSDLQVIIRSANGTETIKTLTTHYTVSGAGNAGGGSITFTAGNIPISTETVVLRRNLPQTQAIDYIANDPFPAESHEEGLDRAMMAIQQLQEEVTRSIKLSKTNTMNSTEFTVGSSARAGKIFGFDSNGELVVSQELGTYRGNWSAGVTYAARDIVKDTSNNNIYLCNTGHTSTGTQPITSNADSAKWDLLVDAASATSSATAAAASASAASTSASNAASSASSASSSASAASSSASASSSSASASAASAASAASSYDSFDDRYLGAKATDPTLDNDSNALIDGALYFDTTNNVMKVYDLGNTTWRRTTPTTSDQTNINTVSGIAADVTTVAGISGNVTSVAGNSSNINSVASNSTNINSVATNIANVNSVATNIANVNSVAGNSVNINSVAGNSANINSVASNSANINTVAGANANITTLAGISADITAVATISADIAAVENKLTEIQAVANDLAEVQSEIDTVANNITNVNNVGNNIANVNTVATNIASVNDVSTNIGSVNDFAARYRVSGTAPSTSLDLGDLYFDTASNTMKVYSSGGWINAGSSVNGTADRFKYTATASQTTFTGPDDNSATLSYDAGFLDVYLNGIKLVNGSDFTASNGTSIVLTTGAAVSDILEVVAYGTFQLANFSITDANDVPPLGTAGQVLKVNSGATGLDFGSNTITINGNAVALGGSTTIQVGTFPTITSISPSTITNDATSITITGTNFVSVPIVEAVNSSTGAIIRANSVSFTSSTSISANFTITVDGTYFIRIENNDGYAARSTNALLTVSDAPVWSTAAGTLGTFSGGGSVSATVAATSDSAVSYSVVSGSLPGGTSLNSGSGVISGTESGATADTTYSFTIRATDGESQTADRAFSITISVGINNGVQFN